MKDDALMMTAWKFHISG